MCCTLIWTRFCGSGLRDRPELRGTPVIVGRPNGRGVVVSATYEARAAGVHSAMPMGRAMRACPQKRPLSNPLRGKYLSASREVMSVLHDVTAQVDEVSIDEAFLDVSGARRTLVHRSRSRGTFVLACSGNSRCRARSVLARSRWLPKIASTFARSRMGCCWYLRQTP